MKFWISLVSLLVLSAGCGATEPANDSTASTEPSPNVRPGKSDTSCECGQPGCTPCVDEARLEILGGYVDMYIAEITLRSYAQDLGDYDFDRLSDDARDILRDSGASDLGFITALRHALLEAHAGHSWIYEGTTYSCLSVDGAGDGGISRYGACAVPHTDGMLVTNVNAGNALGLSPGDLVVEANGVGGDGLVDWSLAQPVCSGSAASPEAVREEAARSFFSAEMTGTVLRVVSPSGEERFVEVPATAPDRLSCRDPLGRATDHAAKALLRPDGVAVIHVPAFLPAGFDPSTDAPAQIAAFEDEILAEFMRVRDDATAIIWDVRSNLGGASLVGLSIASGMPGARSNPIARCTMRIPFSDPPAYDATGPDYDLRPNDKFAFDGPVAILTDGRTFSAGDYFALAVSTSTDALVVGSQTSGSYGGSGAPFAIEGELGLIGAYDAFRCNDVDGNPLETRGTTPDLVVEYDPADIAVGVDTVLEAAAAALQ